MRSKRSGGEIWSAFWLAIPENSVDFLFIFFVYESDSCILIKTSRVQEKEKSNLTPILFSTLELKSNLERL